MAAQASPSCTHGFRMEGNNLNSFTYPVENSIRVHITSGFRNAGVNNLVEVIQDIRNEFPDKGITVSFRISDKNRFF